MQTINFQPLGFEGIPQHRAEARQRYYDAVTKPWSEFGNIVSDTAGKVGDAMYKSAQDDKAEEWRQRQWTNQTYNQYLQNRRYQDERNRQLDERDRQLNEQRLDTEAADRLRQEFMGKYGSQDLSGYGLPAQFAMDGIRNARTWQEVVGAGNALTQAIQYQEMLRGQMGEREAQRAEAAEAEAGERFLGDFNRRAALSGYTPETIGTKYSRIKGSDKNALRQARQTGFEELSGYADELRQYLSDPSVVRRLPPQTLEQLNRRLMAYDEAVSRWSSWMQPRKTTRW